MGSLSAQDTGTFVGPDERAVRFSDLARSPQHEDDPDPTLEQIVQAATAMIPGCDEGSISVVLGRRKVSSRASSGDLPRIVDSVQEETGQGPCMDAVYEQLTVRVADMASEQRWPRFAARALEGAAGMLSFQLYVEGDNLGALNLFSRTAGAFTDHSEHIGLIFAAHAALAYAAAQKLAKMTATVASRQLIGQAEGILIERYKNTGTESFALLVQASQDSNVKLREVAERLILSGELPSLPQRRPADATTEHQDGERQSDGSTRSTVHDRSALLLRRQPISRLARSCLLRGLRPGVRTPWQ